MGKHSMSLKIIAVKSLEELEKIVDLQKKIWDIPYRHCVPSNYLLVARHTGGFVLGAYTDGKLVGFCLTVPAFDKDTPYHHLHMIGICPGYRGLNIGFSILKEHYAMSKSLGVKKVTWSYDPLESMNANLYIRKIGAVVETPYKLNEYGLGIDGKKIPTDRFLATWYVNSQRVTKKFETTADQEDQKISKTIDEFLMNYELVNVVDFSSSRIKKYRLPEQRSIAVEIPVNFKELKKDEELAVDWREKTGKIFSHYLNRGMIVSDFVSIVDNKHEKRRNFYIMEQS